MGSGDCIVHRLLTTIVPLSSMYVLQVAALKELGKDELIDYFNKFIKIDSPQRKTLCVLVYGGPQTAEYKKVIQQEDTPKLHRIKDIFTFRRSRPLFGSFKGGLSLTKL